MMLRAWCVIVLGGLYVSATWGAEMNIGVAFFGGATVALVGLALGKYLE